MIARTLVGEVARRAASIALGPFGLQLERRGRLSIDDVLARARRLGLTFGTVIDAGAAFGDWSRMCHDHFPTARYVLIEPLEEYTPFLTDTAASLPDAVVVRAAAAEESGTIRLHVHADLLGTSRFSEAEEVNGASRMVRSVTLDDLVGKLGARPPFLLKIDVQGSELLVLAGATHLLEQTAFLVLEVSFFPFFDGGPTFEDVVARMRSVGFVVYDVTNPLHRPLDGALAQVDLCFVPESSLLRHDYSFATTDQRRSSETLFRARLAYRRRNLRK